MIRNIKKNKKNFDNLRNIFLKKKKIFFSLSPFKIDFNKILNSKISWENNFWNEKKKIPSISKITKSDVKK